VSANDDASDYVSASNDVGDHVGTSDDACIILVQAIMQVTMLVQATGDGGVHDRLLSLDGKIISRKNVLKLKQNPTSVKK